MSSQPGDLELRKQLLLARSTLYRLRIRVELGSMGDRLGWARGIAGAAQARPFRFAAAGLALYGLANSRAARMLALAARLLLLARLAGGAIGLLRKNTSNPTTGTP